MREGEKERERGGRDGGGRLEIGLNFLIVHYCIYADEDERLETSRLNNTESEELRDVKSKKIEASMISHLLGPISKF